MKTLHLKWINGTIVLLLMAAYSLVFTLASETAFAHATDVSPTTTITVKFAAPVKSVLIVSIEGGINPVCLTVPKGKTQASTTFGIFLPTNIQEYKYSGCKGSIYKTAYVETGAPGTSLTVKVP